MQQQRPSLEKGVPHVVPDILGQYSASAWSDVAVIVPWLSIRFMETRVFLKKTGNVCMSGQTISRTTAVKMVSGRVVPVRRLACTGQRRESDRTGATDKYMIANTYYLYVTDLVKQTAQILGKDRRGCKIRGTVYNNT